MMERSKKHRQSGRFVFFLSAFGTWYLSLAVTAYATAGLIYSPELLAGMLSVVAGVVGITMQIYLGIAFARVLRRIWPVSFEGAADRGPKARGLNAAIVLLSLHCTVLVVGWNLLTADGRLVSPLITPIALVLSAVWVITVALTFVRHTRDANAVMKIPFTLFLRRFSTLSDRSVAHQVMHSNKKRSLVLLVPERTEPEDWNPVTVFMAGVRPWAPVRSTPYFVEAAEGAWVGVVANLIRHAELIVIDGSSVSSSIAQELRLISKLQAWPKTVLLLDRNQTAKDEELGVTPTTTITYECTWRAALPRLILGVVLVIPVSIPVTVPFVLFLEWLEGQLDLGSEILFGIVAVVFLLPGLVFIYKVLFLRPELDSNSKRRLKQALA